MEGIFNKYAKDKDIIGIGTGKTMEEFSVYLPLTKVYIPTSTQSQMLMGANPIGLTMNHKKIDIYFDSADYYNERGDLIKGGGGALTQEKLMCDMAEQTVIIVRKHKFVDKFEKLFVPIEIVKPSYGYIVGILENKGLLYKLRKVNDVIPFVTDLGNIIIDVEFDKHFLTECKTISGVVEHGYFENNGNFMIEELED